MAEKAIERGKPADAAILKKVIEVIDVDNDIEVMKKYYSTAEAWEKHRRLYEEGPSREWQELYRDVNAMLGEDPAAPKAQILADRWLKLAVKAYNGDPELQTCNGTAWMDREHWPASMKRRIAEFNLERVNEFMRRAVLSSRKKYFSTEAWAKLVEMRMDTARISAIWQSRVDLFREVESFLGQDPANEKVKALAVRWRAYLDTASGGDPGVKAGLMNVWADRKNWTATLRWLEETVSMVTGERFDTAADFLDKAVGPADAQISK